MVSMNHHQTLLLDVRIHMMEFCHNLFGTNHYNVGLIGWWKIKCNRHLGYKIVLYSGFSCLDKLFKFPLSPMGALAPGSEHARPSAQPPIDTSRNLLVQVSGRGRGAKNV